MLTYNGVDASKVASVTVTASATVANAALATPITSVISPQSTVFTAGAGGYADLAAPAAPLALIQPIAGGAVYFTDGNTSQDDGVAGASAAAGTTLTGLTYAAYAAGQGPDQVLPYSTRSTTQLPAPLTPRRPDCTRTRCRLLLRRLS